MDFQEYTKRVQRAAQLVERGDYEGAITLLRALIDSDISDRDKAMMCVNLAVVYNKLDRMQEALAWYDKGIAYERRHSRSFVAESKAAYLAERGLVQESVAIYEDLFTQPYLDEGEKERIGKNLEMLRGPGRGSGSA